MRPSTPEKEKILSNFLNTFFSSNLEQLFPFLVVVISIIILAIFALRINEQFTWFGTNLTSNIKSDPQSKAKAIQNTTSHTGEKKTAAVLFIDLRGFHKITQNMGPEQTVTILNSFFEAVGTAVLSEGGNIDNYMGDGLLVVFGKDADPKTGCQQALKAIQKTRQAIRKLNKKLSKQLGGPIQIGIGLHVGPLLIGRLGHSHSVADRVIGPAANFAIRLEELTKQKGSEVIISMEVIRCAEITVEQFNSEFVVIRDNNIPVEVISIPAAGQIPSLQ